MYLKNALSDTVHVVPEWRMMPLSVSLISPLPSMPVDRLPVAVLQWIMSLLTISCRASITIFKLFQGSSQGSFVAVSQIHTYFWMAVVVKWQTQKQRVPQMCCLSVISWRYEALDMVYWQFSPESSTVFKPAASGSPFRGSETLKTPEYSRNYKQLVTELQTKAIDEQSKSKIKSKGQQH